MPRLPDTYGERPTPRPSGAVGAVNRGIVNIDMSAPYRALQGTAIALGNVAAQYQAEQDRLAREQEAQQKHLAAVQQRQQAAIALAKVTNDLYDAGTEVERSVTSGETPTDQAEPALRKRMDEIRAKGLEALTPEQRAGLEPHIEGTTGTIRRGLGGVVIKRQQSEVGAAVDQYAEQALRDVVRIGPAKAAYKYRAFLQFNAGPAGLTPEQEQKAAQRFTEAAYVTSFDAGATAAFEAGDVAKLKDLRTKLGGPEGEPIDPGKRDALSRQIFGFENQIIAKQEHAKAQALAERERAEAKAERAANKAEREAITAYTVVSDRARNGLVTDPATDQILMRQLAGSPVLMKAYQDQAAEIPKRAAVAQLPLVTQQAQIDQLRAMSVAKGTNTELENEIKKREQALSAATAAFKDEPLRAIAERGIVAAIAPMNTMSLDTIEQALPARASQAATAARISGRSAESPMLSVEADKWVAQINALPAGQRGERVASLTSKIGPAQAQALAKQIDAKDRALALELAAGADRTSQGRTTAELIRNGAIAIKDKAVKEDTEAEFGMRALLAKELGGMVNGPARADVLDAARYIWIGKQAKREMMDARGAVELALGGKIIEHNGQQLPAPPGFTDGKFKAGLAAIKPADLSARALMLPSGQALPVDQFLQSLPTATLAPAGSGRYYVLGPGGYVMDAEQRKPLAITVR